MAITRIAPDGLLDQTGLTGSLSAVQDDPDSSTGVWLTTGNNTSTSARVSFPTPAGSISGSQEFRVLVRKTAQSTDPTCTVELWASGSLVSTVVASTSISSTTGVVLSGTWSASLVANAANVECRVSGTPGGGSPGNRASVEVGAIEWNAQSTLAQSLSGALSFTGNLSPIKQSALTPALVIVHTTNLG